MPCGYPRTPRTERLCGRAARNADTYHTELRTLA